MIVAGKICFTFSEVRAKIIASLHSYILFFFFKVRPAQIVNMLPKANIGITNTKLF